MLKLFFLNEEAGKFVENISVLHKWDKDDCKRRMEAVSLFVILNSQLVRETLFLSRKRQRILKTDNCSNYKYAQTSLNLFYCWLVSFLRQKLSNKNKIFFIQGALYCYVQYRLCNKLLEGFTLINLKLLRDWKIHSAFTEFLNQLN